MIKTGHGTMIIARIRLMQGSWKLRENQLSFGRSESKSIFVRDWIAGGDVAETWAEHTGSALC
jgi:hypothetical protein